MKGKCRKPEPHDSFSIASSTGISRPQSTLDGVWKGDELIHQQHQPKSNELSPPMLDMVSSLLVHFLSSSKSLTFTAVEPSRQRFWGGDSASVSVRQGLSFKAHRGMHPLHALDTCERNYRPEPDAASITSSSRNRTLFSKRHQRHLPQVI